MSVSCPIAYARGDYHRVSVLLLNPLDSVKLCLKASDLNHIAQTHGLRHNEMILATPKYKARSPLRGCIIYNCYHCMVRAPHPLNQSLVGVLVCLKIFPFQLYPNAYTTLLGLLMLFHQVEGRDLTYRESRYFYNIKRKKESPSLFY